MIYVGMAALVVAGVFFVQFNCYANSKKKQ